MSCVHDEIIVECDEADVLEVMTEVQAIMETRSAQSFNGQTIGGEAHVADNWGWCEGAGIHRHPKHRKCDAEVLAA